MRILRNILIATVLLVAAGSARADPEPQIEVSLQLDKPSYEVGEAIPVTLEIFNRSTDEYSALSSTEPTGVRDGISFTVTDAAGDPIPRPPTLPKADTWIGSWLVLRPHEKCERKLFLNHWFVALPPGRFAVQAAYVARTTNDWPAVQSNRVEFDIQPTTSTKLDVRITRLAEQAERGDQIAIDFLGFTGENAAIGPLIEALYFEDFHLQRRAAVALCLINDQPAALKAVLQKVEQTGPTAMAAEWLSVVRARPAVVLPLYFRAMNSNESAARLGGMTGLRLTLDAALADKKFSTTARWAIRHGLRDRDARVRYEAVLTTQLYSDPQIIGILKGIAEGDPVRRVRRAAAATLKEITKGNRKNQ